MVDKNLLRHLAKKYPDVKSATEEIVNRNAILSLPKGTEYFFSDLHGEHEAFIHMLKLSLIHIYGNQQDGKDDEDQKHCLYERLTEETLQERQDLPKQGVCFSQGSASIFPIGSSMAFSSVHG